MTSTQADAAPIGVGTIWKSARDKSRCIEARLCEFNGSRYAEFRMLQLNDQGRMVPNGKGITVSIKQLGRFSELVGNTYRKASALTAGSS